MADKKMGFTCPKCGHDKYSWWVTEGIVKCKKCGHEWEEK